MAQESITNKSGSPPTTGHEWDGIQEYNQPLPRWWLWVLYATIVWAIGYWIVMPSWPLVSGYSKGLLGYSQRLVLKQEMQDARDAQAKYITRISEMPLKDIRTDPTLLEFALAGGRSGYVVNCSQCHGSGATGSPGYPNLNDDAWLWGGGLEDIHKSILYGIRSDHEETRDSSMPAFLKDEILKQSQIDDVTQYVLALSARATDAEAAKRGAEVYKAECAACHQPTGKGNKELGAPDLTDSIWLFGGDRDTIARTVAYSRRGVMPAWINRLDAVTIKQIAIYVHSLGGGK